MKRLSLAFPAMVVMVLAGCRDKSVAEVNKHQGDLTRDTASTVGKWEPAADGAKLNIGDGLKTGHNAEAVVRLTRGGKLKMPADSTIRFLASAPGASSPRLAVEVGEARVEAEGSEVLLETSIGTARIESGGAIRLSPTDNGTRIEVSFGAARIETGDGGIALSPGHALDVSATGAITERDLSDAGAPDAATALVVDAGASADPTAAFADVHDRGIRKQAKGATTWTPLADGRAQLNPGDTIDVPAGAAVSIGRGAQQARIVGASRVVIGEPGGALARATTGKVELSASGEEVRVDVPGGSIVAKAGKSRVDAEIAATGTKIAVKQGDGEIRGTTTEALKTGDTATLGAKGAVLVGRGPDRVDFSVRGGESIVIRDPKPPTALGFDFSSLCPGAAVLTRDENTSVRGDRKANLSVPIGYHPYAIRCIGPDGVEDKPAATGTITVIADAAKADLPRVPPSTVVDADGRPYTILYQNLLPSVVVRWPDAPPSASYVLSLDGKKKPAGPARQVLPAGAVGEGTHKLKLETADGSKSSPETTLIVKFDNAAPAASVREPADGSFAPGASVNVAGVVVEGWTVSIAGQPVTLDEQHRFSTTVTPTAGENAVVLRLSHKQHGVIYYVRHAASAGARP